MKLKKCGKDILRKKEISGKKKADIQRLMEFVGIYCREDHHQEKAPFSFRFFDIKEIEKQKISLCKDCTHLLSYGLTMRMRCPHDPKPMCKKCETQCYHGNYQSKIREVMKFSGMFMIRHGRVDMLYHYFR